MISTSAVAQSPFMRYRSERDYRAVLFSSAKLNSLADVIQLFEGQPLKNKEQTSPIQFRHANTEGIRVSYRSENCFLRTNNQENKDALLVRNSRSKTRMYEYEVCALSYTQLTTPVFLVAVPFASMARELFGKIHDHKPSADFKYLRPSLDDVVSALVEGDEDFSRIRTVGINWTIAGEKGYSEQITLRGQDVLHSRAYKYLCDPDADLSLTLRKVQVIHEGFGGRTRLKLTFDKFGNYGIWASEETANLPDVFKVFEIFKKNRLIKEETAFPVRDRKEQPLLP